VFEHGQILGFRFKHGLAFAISSLKLLSNEELFSSILLYFPSRAARSFSERLITLFLIIVNVIRVLASSFAALLSACTSYLAHAGEQEQCERKDRKND